MTTNWDDLPLILTVAEARRVLRRRLEAVYELCRQGQLPCSRLGRAYQIPREALRQFVEAPLRLSPVPIPADTYPSSANVPTPIALRPGSARPRFHIKPARGGMVAAGSHGGRG